MSQFQETELAVGGLNSQGSVRRNVQPDVLKGLCVTVVCCVHRKQVLCAWKLTNSNVLNWGRSVL